LPLAELTTDQFLEKHSGEVLIFVLSLVIAGVLLIVVPQLLRHSHKSNEMLHAEHLRALENGQPLPPYDVKGRAAGRTAALVPMVAMICAATVTGFLIAYRFESLFAVSLAVWIVSGLVSLAAVTGGVALLGRLAQLDHGLPEEDDTPKT
jgi:hypothetical protein